MEQDAKSRKLDRVMMIFLLGLKGEEISVGGLAQRYNVSTKTISRDLNEIKGFLADQREVTGHGKLEYCHGSKNYRLIMDDFLSDQEITALIEILIGSRAIDGSDLQRLTDKLIRFTAPEHRDLLKHLIKNELKYYSNVHIECDNLLDTLWKINQYIKKGTELSIQYLKMNGSTIDRRIKPLAIMFTDYYFYLIAIAVEEKDQQCKYYRIDRIKNIVEHQDALMPNKSSTFNEGKLRKKSLLMWPGPSRKVVFEFTGPSLQAILDKIPTAEVVEKKDGKCVIEAEVDGDGIKMFLLSQGSWVKVLGPKEFVEEMKEELEKMARLYKI